MSLKGIPPSLQQFNKRFPSAMLGGYGDWAGLYQMPFNKVAELAEWAGQRVGKSIPGVTMAQVSLGEGNLRPGSESTDGGFGMWGYTPRAAGIRLGQSGPSVHNPIVDAEVMADIYPPGWSGGSPWYGTGSVKSYNAHYQGALKKMGGIIPWFGDGGQITARRPTLIGIGDKGKETATITKGDPPAPIIQVHLHGGLDAMVDEIEMRIDGARFHDGQMARMG